MIEQETYAAILWYFVGAITAWIIARYHYMEIKVNDKEK